MRLPVLAISSKSSLHIYHARQIAPFITERPACGHELFKPPEILTDAWLMLANGRIQAVTQKRPSAPGASFHDLGDVALLPPFFNCHTHLQLSWLASRLRLGHGFTAWLKSLVPHLLPLAQAHFPVAAAKALARQCRLLAGYGALGVGDVGGSLPGALAAAHRGATASGLAIRFFCENFGFGPASSPWPDRCLADLRKIPSIAPLAAPCGHALYSTSGEKLRRAHAWCAAHGRPFSIHLAESPEETELLASGCGPLYSYYQDMVLPQGWRAPNLPPLAYASRLGILTPATIAVHCVQLDRTEIAALAASGTTVCLCPRSNAAIGVGQPRVEAFIEAGALLCLGTDGLSSAPDLDLRREALFLHVTHNLPWPALWRMAISNGAAALGFRQPCLAPGQPGRFSIWPLADVP